MQTRSYLVHSNGPALWPEHKPLPEVLDLKDTTIEHVWETTYQGNPTPPGGMTFKRDWWIGKNRYRVSDSGDVVGRYISWDTGLKDKETSDFTAGLVGELWADYRLAVRYVKKARIEFPYLPTEIREQARRFNHDGKLLGVIIEDKASGTSAYQTLMAEADDWLKPLLIAFNPTVDKLTRANQAAVWCKNGCVLFPEPSNDVPWLLDFESEIFDFPSVTNDDQVDVLSQLVIFLENILAEGWRARNGAV